MVKSIVMFLISKQVIDLVGLSLGFILLFRYLHLNARRKKHLNTRSVLSEALLVFLTGPGMGCGLRLVLLVVRCKVAAIFPNVVEPLDPCDSIAEDPVPVVIGGVALIWVSIQSALQMCRTDIFTLAGLSGEKPLVPTASQPPEGT